jgi:hypothetical protein
MTQQAQSDTPSRGWWQSRRSIQLDSIQALLGRIDAALIVRDPGTARSVDAYDGLRKQVALAAGDRQRMLVMLSEVAEALRLRQQIEELESKAEEWMLQSNLVRVNDPEKDEAFEVVGAGIGPVIVTVPAYMDGSSGSIVRRGIAERTQSKEGQPVLTEAASTEHTPLVTTYAATEEPETTVEETD